MVSETHTAFYSMVPKGGNSGCTAVGGEKLIPNIELKKTGDLHPVPPHVLTP
jgi:hypothetical protein